MSALKQLKAIDSLILKHDVRAAAYVEAKRLVPLVLGANGPRAFSVSVVKEPIHFYMHLLPGFNTHFVPTYFRGWIHLRPFDVRQDPKLDDHVRVELNPAFRGINDNKLRAYVGKNDG